MLPGTQKSSSVFTAELRPVHLWKQGQANRTEIKPYHAVGPPHAGSAHRSRFRSTEQQCYCNRKTLREFSSLLSTTANQTLLLDYRPPF